MPSPDINPAIDLAQESDATRALLRLLEQEQACLVKADAQSLPRLTEEKAKIAGQLSDLAKRRHKTLADAGFEATEAGMQAWLQSPQARPSDSEAWNGLLALARSAKEMNRVNGVLINQHMARNQAALSALQGNKASGDFYGPDGQSTAKIGGRRLVVG